MLCFVILARAQIQVKLFPATHCVIWCSTQLSKWFMSMHTVHCTVVEAWWFMDDARAAGGWAAILSGDQLTGGVQLLIPPIDPAPVALHRIALHGIALHYCIALHCIIALQLIVLHSTGLHWLLPNRSSSSCIATPDHLPARRWGGQGMCHMMSFSFCHHEQTNLFILAFYKGPMHATLQLVLNSRNQKIEPPEQGCNSPDIISPKKLGVQNWPTWEEVLVSYSYNAIDGFICHTTPRSS